MSASVYSHPEEQSFALNQLDLKLKPFLNFNGGFFVEAGANDGVNQSNTLFYEKFRNWRGILVEPIPQLAARCQENRPGCIVENCALVPFTHSRPVVEMYYCDLMSMVKGAQKTPEADQAHVRRGCEVQGLDAYELTVPARTLTALLDQHAPPPIDLLALDVEGAELDVLQGLDFEKYQPTYLLIEARFRQEVDEFLAPDYVVVAELSHHDVLYKSKRQIEREKAVRVRTPVAFFIFNRPELTARVFSRIAEVKPETLLVVADGPRSAGEAGQCAQARRIIDQVDWDCRLLTNFSEQNLGCKKRVSSGLSWVYSQVEEAIILEDDCLPGISFFPFCEELLERYRHDERIFMVSGDNFQSGRSRTRYSYYLSRYPHVWGWASWRRAWKHFDVAMQSWTEFKNAGHLRAVFETPQEQEFWADILQRSFEDQTNSWAFVWCYTCWSQGALTVLPDVNLVSNLGFGEEATHTVDRLSPIANLPTGEIWRISHPPFLVRQADADTFTFEQVFTRKG